MRIWEEFEELLFAWNEVGKTSFTQTEVAEDLGVSGPRATQLIQAYLDAQLAGKQTLFVLKRTGRTTNAIWHIGTTKDDYRKVLSQFSDDTENRISEYLSPMVDLIVDKNPRMRQRAIKTVLRIGRLVQSLEELARS